MVRILVLPGIVSGSVRTLGLPGVVDDEAVSSELGESLAEQRAILYGS